jgi:hypothetical protein
MIGISYAAHATSLSPKEKFNARTDELLKSATSQQKEQYAEIFLSHTTIRAVEHTDNIVQTALKSCIKHNPELKSEFSSLSKGWAQTIKPVLRNGNQKVTELIRAQTLTKPLTIKSHLKTYDQMVQKQQALIKTTPISSADDCKTLSKKIETLDDYLVTLITETLQLNKTTL